MLNAKNILLGFTTEGKINWREKIQELAEFNIKEIALLPNALDMKARKELYKELEASPVESIPYVRLCDDMTQEEVDYLVAKYKTKILSVHADSAGFAVLDKMPKYSSVIYIENSPLDKLSKFFTRKQFDEHRVSGICLDLAHLESIRRDNKPVYKKVQAMLSHYTIECNHVSAVSSSMILKMLHKKVASHDLKTLAELDYLRKFPEQYFSKYIVIELENSLEEQIEVQKHLANMLEYVISQEL